MSTFSYTVVEDVTPNAVPPHYGSVVVSTPTSGTYDSDTGPTVTATITPNTRCGWVLGSAAIIWTNPGSTTSHTVRLTSGTTTHTLSAAYGDVTLTLSVSFLYRGYDPVVFGGAGKIIRDGANEKKILRGSRDETKILIDL